MSEFLRISLGSSFLLNAGVLGLVNTLEYMGARLGDNNDEECDYIIDGQTLMVSEEFLASHDMGKEYVKSMVAHLHKYTNLYRILNKEERLKLLIKEYSGVDAEPKKLLEKEIKEIKEIYSEFAKKLESNSFLSGYVILQDQKVLQEDIPSLIKQFKAETDLNIKHDIYRQIYDIASSREVSEVLYFKDLMYTKLNMFLSDTSFFLPANLKSNISAVYAKDFYTPLIEMIKGKKVRQGKKQSLGRCIECTEFVKTSFLKPISFMSDTTDDMARKKSYYWNLKPDAYLCPVCAFVYTFVPLGFAFLGQDAVFVNSNSDITAMRDLMSTYKTRAEEELQDSKRASSARMYKAFTVKAEMLENKLDNVQVIVKRRENSHYGMNIVDRHFVARLRKSAQYLERLESRTIKVGDRYVKIYDEIFDNLLLRRNQYSLIGMLLRYHLDKSDDSGYIKNILQIQIIFWGGSHVENMQKTANTAWNFGKDMRNSFSDAGEKDKDNKLRGLVYQLSNALTVGSREQFLNLIIRIYASRGTAIPYIFKNCFESDDMFKTIGYGYVLGLKSNAGEKENNQNKSEETING